MVGGLSLSMHCTVFSSPLWNDSFKMNTAHWARFEVYLIRLLSPLKYPIHFKLLIAFLSLNPVLIGLRWPHITAFIWRRETVLRRLEMKFKKRKKEKKVFLSFPLLDLSMSNIYQVCCREVKTNLTSCFLFFFFRLLFGFLLTFYLCCYNNLDAAAFCCWFCCCGSAFYRLMWLLIPPEAYLIKFSSFNLEK